MKKRNNTKKYFTVMILSDSTSKVRRYTFSRSFLKFLAVASTAGIMISLYLFFNYIEMREKIWELHSLKEEVKTQRLQLLTLTSGLTDFKKQLVRLKDLDAKLRRFLPSSTYSYTERGLGGSPEITYNLQGKKQTEILDQIHEELVKLKNDARKQETGLQSIISFFEDKQYRRLFTPSIWPIRGHITSGFGYRNSPFNGNKEFHAGVDISIRTGMPVVATADGIVSFTGVNGGLGRVVEIEHGYGLKTVYGHNSHIVVEVGKKVKRGDVIAYSGSSGNTTGPHLHYEVRINNTPVNPLRYM